MATVVLNLATQTWSTVDPAILDGGSAAMYAPGKIIKTGLGRDPDLEGVPSVATAYVLDMTLPAPTWHPESGRSSTASTLSLRTYAIGP